MSNEPTLTARRSFLKTLGGLTAGMAAFPTLTSAQAATPARPATAKYMGDFAAPKLDKIKVAIIGVGARGSGHAAQLATLEGVDFVGVCDVRENAAKSAQGNVTQHGHSPKVYFGDENAWQKMLAETRRGVHRHPVAVARPDVRRCDEGRSPRLQRSAPRLHA